MVDIKSKLKKFINKSILSNIIEINIKVNNSKNIVGM